MLQVGDGLARVYGLENCIAMEMLELEHGVTGIAFNLEEDNVGSPLFGDWDKSARASRSSAPARSSASRSATRSWPGRQPARPAARRPGADQDDRPARSSSRRRASCSASR